MDEEFNISDAMIDIMIDQLHKCAELEEEELENDEEVDPDAPATKSSKSKTTKSNKPNAKKRPASSPASVGSSAAKKPAANTKKLKASAYEMAESFKKGTIYWFNPTLHESLVVDGLTPIVTQHIFDNTAKVKTHIF